VKIKNAVVAGVMAFGFSQFANAQGYSFVDLGTLGGEFSHGYEINDLGQVVGMSTSAHGAVATIWNGGVASQIVTSRIGVTRSEAFGINNLGQIVGFERTVAERNTAVAWSGGSTTVLPWGTSNLNKMVSAINDHGTVAGWDSVAVVWKDGVRVPLSTPTVGVNYSGPPPIYTQAYDINNSGQVVGVTIHPVDPYGSLATLWSNGVGTILESLEPTRGSGAKAINSLGVIAGYSFSASGSRATKWQGGSIVDLGIQGGDSWAAGLNDIGQIIGGFSTDLGINHSFLWDDGNFIDLNTVAFANDSQGWTLLGVHDINNLGQILGRAVNKQGHEHAVLLNPCGSCAPYVPPPIVVIDPPPIIDPPPVTTPVPEPETYAMLLAGLGLLGLFAKRRRQKLNA
jgi:probable HAF family extracellular repeat protein